jgi:SPP1 gp7 family putative phage head morphogenesis protein
MKSDAWKAKRKWEKEYENVLYSAFRKAVELPVRVISSTEFILDYAKRAAIRLITGLKVENAKTWREAARESGKSDLLYKALRSELRGPVGSRVNELIRQNAELISTFPTSIARRVSAAAAAQGYAGGRAEALAAEGPLANIVRSRARLIARTEISKASSALTQARSEELGLDWYEWMTSEDERVRKSHRKIQGVLVRFDDPPSPENLIGEHSTLGHYGAGNAPNCRCYPAPVVRFERLTWPHRVYFAGRIQYMTLSNFRLINQRRIAA